MKKTTIDTCVGIFVLIGIACVGYLTVKLGQMDWIGQNHYSIFANFDSITGLRKGGQIEMAGVQIGHIADISLDLEKQIAVVEMKIQNEVVLTDDVIASVKTAGLIGDKYIKLSSGGSDEILKPGDLITETESALDLEEMVSKYVFGGV
ncbi:MAG: outer membrane lipid asymmetry maintenance protein MlaD [Desulfobacterales bacterium]|jgi:phospholipid/cholesterol/gamma-HCH transport system substrate-binding protein|nr:outer membrane lipid asymmetry maintenance protein MlaD [Desulfobacter sp.]MDP6394938.1 outer membrane lipid asymmetry maintenance protein MlaD [Desulfobacterales bacterium]MDP6682445.1 outer membrane lipid asymmetry maintenance protein MlaD [Desulfobacterales bacterium]MDP6807195.1 outer membrane lipid asymmetry maintenance protein MlaD [Desulfobacterales bacterium]|tara:strand:- start:38512 stop:38958 length:447 start_codon:yes stop_codon:yes gene_type:complete